MKSPFLRRLVVCGCIALCSLVARAQAPATGTVTGRVFNLATQEYVRNAEIRLEGTQQTTVTESAVRLGRRAPPAPAGPARRVCRGVRAGAAQRFSRSGPAVPRPVRRRAARRCPQGGDPPWPAPADRPWARASGAAGRTIRTCPPPGRPRTRSACRAGAPQCHWHPDTQPATGGSPFARWGGALALLQADPQRFALVITDQTMPRMTGLVLAGELQQIRSGLPIILTSGYSQVITPEGVTAAGIRELLHKPFTIHSLGCAVHAALHPPQPLRTYGSNSPH